jgi:hypothetical protein
VLGCRKQTGPGGDREGDYIATLREICNYVQRTTVHKGRTGLEDEGKETLKQLGRRTLYLLLQPCGPYFILIKHVVTTILSCSVLLPYSTSLAGAPRTSGKNPASDSFTVTSDACIPGNDEPRYANGTILRFATATLLLETLNCSLRDGVAVGKSSRAY